MKVAGVARAAWNAPENHDEELGVSIAVLDSGPQQSLPRYFTEDTHAEREPVQKG